MTVSYTDAVLNPSDNPLFQLHISFQKMHDYVSIGYSYL